MPIVLESEMRSTLRGLGRSMQRLNKEALLKTGEWWHSQIFPKHFLASAKTTYRYQRRKPSTKAIKTEQGKDPGLDLVQTGQSKRFMAVDPRFRATSTRGRVIMDAPAYWKGVDPGEPNKADEATAINDADRRRMGLAHSEHIAAAIKAYREKTAAQKV